MIEDKMDLPLRNFQIENIDDKVVECILKIEDSLDQIEVCKKFKDYNGRYKYETIFNKEVSKYKMLTGKSYQLKED